ncbi:Hsp20/alpha crystallin family protein [Novipirellula sp. SH528]|uniref:Hsp20/alpha crystallin family protein n=1 Tax=Novipirellula sp. SH528 TaxID=3454466 RepID=UPI003FA171B4
MVNTRWQTAAELNRLRSELERAFAPNGRGSATTTTGVYPPMNLWENDDNLYIEAELPGFEMDDLEIYVTGGNQISISGERKQPELEGGAWHRQERTFGKIRRTYDLPCDVNVDDVSANFTHGVLTLTMPKSEEVKPRRIEVKAN